MWDGAWTDRRKWYESEDQYVRRQRAEGEQRAADSDARLRSSLSQVSAQKEALGRELANLSAAFDAFVELTSVRAQLGRHVASAEAREQARALLARLRASNIDAATTAVTADSAVPAVPADSADFDAVPGYWLPSAAVGLAASIRDDRPVGEAALARAAAADERRTALFLTLAAPVLGRSELASPWLARALGTGPSSPDDRIDTAARELWREAGLGGYGDAGRDVVVRWLGGASVAETASLIHVQLTRFPAGTDVAPELSARLPVARVAVAALTKLHQLLAAEPSPANMSTNKAVRTAARSDAKSAPVDAVPMDLAEAEARAEAEAEAEAAPALSLLESLISEGSPAEAGLLRHAEELAAKVRQYRHIEAEDRPPRWDEPVGTLFDLLWADLRAASTAEAGVRAVAQAALRRAAAEVAGSLLAEASFDCPAVLALRLDGRPVEIRADEPLVPQLAGVDARIKELYAEPGHVSRKRSAELELRIAERRSRVYQEAERAVTRFNEQLGQLPELRRNARREHAAVVECLDRLARQEGAA